ncbi:hypothetical protein BDF14DRAFT_1378420 [Spinellus fusiger]|nr:hypothetical protein BDF14DRAFT_1378420 [Spinellus fusiger]
MSASFNKVYFGLATATVCIPCFAAYYLYNTGYTWMALVLNITTLALMTVFISVFLGYKIIRFGAPYVFALLSRANRILTPIALGISRTRVVGPLLSLVIRFNFFMCFMLLLLCDRVVRRVLGRCVGKHISQHLVSVCNAIDPDFQMFDEKVQSLSCFEDIGDEITQSTYSIPSSPMPCYSQSLAYTLAVAIGCIRI